MKTYCILFALPLLLACESEKKATKLEDSLETANHAMVGELSEKDSVITNREAAISQFITSFNEISENLKKIKVKENILDTRLNSTELKTSEKDQILQDIQSIYHHMNESKRKLASMSQRLKKSNLRIEDLETAITNLNGQLAEKDSQIADLKSKLEKLNVDFSNLQAEYNAEKQNSEQKTAQLNSAYYTIGSTKELEKKKIITKTGGFVGIGKTKELNENVNNASFTKVDITMLSEIPLNGTKKATLITEHPSDSYQLVKNGKHYDKLVITNADKFWGVSKYLVISIEK